MSLDEIAARLDDRFSLLTGGSRTAIPRHQTLRATIDWSHELLTDPERVLFRRMRPLRAVSLWKLRGSLQSRNEAQ